MIVIINTLNLAERLRSLQEDEHSKLTIGAFFEFMRTAYQVNDSFEGLSTILSSNSEIDWHELARINLDVAKCEDNKVNNDNLSVQEGNKDANLMQDLLLQTISSKETYASENAINFQSSVTSCSTCISTDISETCTKNDSTQESNSAESSTKCSETVKEVNQLLESHIEKEKRSKEHLEESECGLAKIMKDNLRDILHEGLLDSVLPYMLPKSALSQPVIKKSAAPTIDVKKSSSLGNIGDNKMAALNHKERDKEKNKTNKKSLE